MEQSSAVALFIVALIFFVRNLLTMEQLQRLSLRIERKRFQIASHVDFVVQFNDNVISELKDKTPSDITISAAPETPAAVENANKAGRWRWL